MQTFLKSGAHTLMKVAIGLCCLMLAPALVHAQIEDSDGATLETVITEVKRALKEAQSNNVPGFPRLKTATISLNTVVTKEAGGKISFLIFSIGSKKQTESASTLALTLAPPPTTSPTGSQAVNPENLRIALARAINLSKQAILQSDQDPTGENLPRLVLNGVKIELKFAVSRKKNAGVDLTELLPIGIEGEGKIDRSKIHTIELVFSNT